MTLSTLIIKLIGHRRIHCMKSFFCFEKPVHKFKSWSCIERRMSLGGGGGCFGNVVSLILSSHQSIFAYLWQLQCPSNNIYTLTSCQPRNIPSTFIYNALISEVSCYIYSSPRAWQFLPPHLNAEYSNLFNSTFPNPQLKKKYTSLFSALYNYA
jgi:hypothetical protein